MPACQAEKLLDGKGTPVNTSCEKIHVKQLQEESWIEFQ